MNLWFILSARRNFTDCWWCISESVANVSEKCGVPMT